MKVSDNEIAISYLHNISYYRLSAYFLPFKHSEQFKPNVHFQEIINLYRFDRKLRLLVLDAIETIEVSIRARIIYQLSHAYGAFGYTNSKNFSNKFKHTDWLKHLEEAISKSKETFVEHYRNKYAENQHMPLWMALEVISFGELSFLFKGMHGNDQQIIADHYCLKNVVLVSWLHTLAYVRNLCAHHSRLWNRILTVKPKVPNKSPIWRDIANNRTYCLLLLIQHLLSQINPQITWKYKLQKLLLEIQNNYAKAMGFPHNWERQLLWNFSFEENKIMELNSLVC